MQPDLIMTNFLNFSAIIFVIDSTDKDRMYDAKCELERTLNEDELKNAALLIYANKQVHRIFFFFIHHT